MKNSAGCGEEKAVRVARNGGDGAKRAWNPAVRECIGCKRKFAFGKLLVSGLLAFGTPKGQRTSREDVWRKWHKVADLPGAKNEDADVVLEGE